MANRVTENDKIKINELYVKLKTYAAVARETGFSASTVKKYVVPGYIPQEKIIIRKFEGEIPDSFPPLPKNPHEWKELLKLSPEEIKGIEELRKEVLI